jgi:hypothetical protein
LATDRKYAKQNIERAKGHFDYIINYLNEVGNMFTENGMKHSENIEEWPQEYQDVLTTVVNIINSMQTLKETMDILKEMF